MEAKKKKTIYHELSRIQGMLEAPKGQYNAFSKFKYRSCEDIVEAVKPLLGNLVLILDDDIVVVGDRYYVKATATVMSDVESVSSTAFAREALTKKGMDEAQITGSSSSYARKYALNGLFAIDDTKDADTKNSVETSTPRVPNATTTLKARQKQFFAVAHEKGLQVENAKEFVKNHYKVDSFNDLSVERLTTTIEKMKGLDSVMIKKINTFGDEEINPFGNEDVRPEDILDGSV